MQLFIIACGSQLAVSRDEYSIYLQHNCQLRKMSGPGASIDSGSICHPKSFHLQFCKLDGIMYTSNT